MSPKQIVSASWKLAAVLFCIVSSATAAMSGNFTYTVFAESVTIDSYPDGAIGPVVIPQSIEGKTVTAIAEDAFQFCSEVTSIQSPFGVTHIGAYAFFGCTGLTNVSISGSVTNIGTQAFLNCTSLEGVTIPASVTSIGDRAFEYCTAMTAIMVDALNPAYSSSSGILFDKSKSVLIECPAELFSSHEELRTAWSRASIHRWRQQSVPHSGGGCNPAAAEVGSPRGGAGF